MEYKDIFLFNEGFFDMVLIMRGVEEGIYSEIVLIINFDGVIYFLCILGL